MTPFAEPVHAGPAPTASLRQRLAARERLLSTFVKTTSHQTVEVLAATGLDTLVLDAEHAPFGPESLDRSLLAGHACGLPVLVRVPYPRAAAIQQALDLGAAGVMVPHVDDARIATEVVRAARYGQGGTRGFSTASRAGGYGLRSMADHLRASDEHTAVIVQIESAQAVAEAAAIAAVPGVDCLFVGPADLAVSFGATGTDDPRVAEAMATVCAAGRAAGRAVGCFVPDARAVPDLGAMGASFFVVGSDQALLRKAARQVMAGAAESEAACAP
ncbi:HpcH/HpaI aldolase family protein [Paracidovorax anthurii]|uniref:2-keto-3-deoxy-L-rhamnonate aldolase RhmA n=1 Tax=Paracidovorax anthurii TaxID=78229 RepID=A0A328ZUD6_9BURK|nr:aldolase/citrate lyase family protein [Paracidovorax anthurii]RAR85866.1 2-keto-3-deoxy-L-rhamnonate aldolase RhmA [Paracidovorax anthurii]